jgi:hypothetical protein
VDRDIVVLAGGWSVCQIPDHLAVIAQLRRKFKLVTANDSSMYCDPEVVVSMDRIWSSRRVPELLEKYTIPPEMWIRRGVIPAPTPLPPRFNFFSCDIDQNILLSLEPGTLNGNNSGVCAINYALQSRPKRVFLLGFDMQRGPKGEQHWYDGTWSNHKASKGKFAVWVKRFQRIYQQFSAQRVELINVTSYSAIPPEVIPRWTPKQLISVL